MNKPSVRVGVYNWAEFARDDSFYPEDMPAEWRLSYFANEFESACLDLSASGLSAALLGESLEDLAENFELSLAVSEISHIATILELIQQHELRAQWLIFDDHSGKHTAGDLQRQLEQHVGELAASGLGPVTWRRRSQIWTPAHAHISSELAILPAAESLAGSRGWIEQWLENAPADEATPLTLWCEADIEYSRLAELRTLVELMGL